MKYLAYRTTEIEKNKYSQKIETLDTAHLPDNDVLIEVHYSSLNYKDALSAMGHKGITRRYPHTPGIDASGIVAESKSELFKAGDEVIVTGYDLGMNTSGGFGQYIKVPAEWLVKLPENLTLREAMMYGTAGFTAGISMFEFEQANITTDKGKILVTGASGGVGSLAVGMLNSAGYEVIASTGKEDKEFFNLLGGAEIIPREEVNDDSPKPLLAKRWKGVIETVGGNTLNTAIRSTDHRGVICTMGNVAGDSTGITVYPFILRGVKLVGIDSASRPMDERLYIWNKISSDWKIDNIAQICKEITLNELDDEINKILNGEQKGRVIINLKNS
jgi:acrylyl-CoA reductase (NADPH)